MVKLINADKLKRHYAWWEDEKQRTFDEIVDYQPAVDAIPVDWIVKWCADHMEHGTMTIAQMLEDWKNEVVE